MPTHDTPAGPLAVRKSTWNSPVGAVSVAARCTAMMWSRPGMGAAQSAGMQLLAASVVLLVGSGLLIRSFLALQAVEPGYDGDNVLSLRVPMNDRTPPELTHEGSNQL